MVRSCGMYKKILGRIEKVKNLEKNQKYGEEKENGCE